MQRQPTPPSSSIMIPTTLLLALVVAAIATAIELRRRHAQATLMARLEEMTRRTDRLEQVLREDLSRHRTETLNAVSSLGSALQQQTTEIARLTQAQLESLRSAVDSRLSEIRTDNAAQLDAMRATVDEKLQGTLERRLGDSFRLVADRLELVQRGLGEMQTLAVGVGDLKRVMSNVRRGGAMGRSASRRCSTRSSRRGSSHGTSGRTLPQRTSSSSRSGCPVAGTSAAKAHKSGSR